MQRRLDPPTRRQEGAVPLTTPIRRCSTTMTRTITIPTVSSHPASHRTGNDSVSSPRVQRSSVKMLDLPVSNCKLLELENMKLANNFLPVSQLVSKYNFFKLCSWLINFVLIGYDPLLPFKEDLAEWLYKMIRAEIAPNKFFPVSFKHEASIIR